MRGRDVLERSGARVIGETTGGEGCRLLRPDDRDGRCDSVRDGARQPLRLEPEGEVGDKGGAGAKFTAV